MARIFLTALSLVAEVQCIHSLRQPQDKKVLRDFININGTEYFIDTTKAYGRDESKAVCEFMNMVMISFEAREKWNTITSWLMEDLLLNYQWFWISGTRDENSRLWYWEPTGREITEFFWGANQPTMDDNLVKACTSFSVYSGGFDDDPCEENFGAAFCE